MFGFWCYSPKRYCCKIDANRRSYLLCLLVVFVDHGNSRSLSNLDTPLQRQIRISRRLLTYYWLLLCLLVFWPTSKRNGLWLLPQIRFFRALYTLFFFCLPPLPFPFCERGRYLFFFLFCVGVCPGRGRGGRRGLQGTKKAYLRK